MKEYNNEVPLVASELSIAKNEIYKGCYALGNNKTNTLCFYLSWKPKWLHRQMMRIFFGWYWFDKK
jgi:hypothetical protein